MSPPAPTLPRLDLIPAGDLMQGILVGCDAAAPPALIARFLAEERIHCLVVGGIERMLAGECWGIVTDRDLIRALDANDVSATAGTLAVTVPVTVEPHESVDRAVQLMASHDVTHVIVVENGHPVGIVSALDVARAASGV